MSNLKDLPTLVLALVVAASAGSDVNAASAKKKRVQASQSVRAAAGQSPNLGNPTPSRSGDSYYENILGSQVFGSQRWWDVYGRQRGSPH
ncbi:MAG: hypothetical protein AB7O44_05450 [Hyphomicrobiaceae bacterium]